MESNEDFLTKLANITKCIDELGLGFEESVIKFTVTEKDYDNIFNFFQTKYKRIVKKPKKEFLIDIGNYKFEFSKSNV